MKQKIVIGLSGGIDSSIAALLLKQQNFDVTAVSLKMRNNTENKYLDNAKNIADFLQIKFDIIDATEDFEKIVINDFINKYTNGETPSPCIICNKSIKWEYLFNYAKQNNFDFMASGHYVNIIKRNDTYYISEGFDKIKDQSYFLWNSPQNFLKIMKTPLGKFSKEEIKKIAEKTGLYKFINKKESMGVCFLDKKNYRIFLQKRGININNEGNILSETGEIIGKHKGIANYTTGQKSELNIFSGKTLYVKNINANTNTLTAVNKHKLNIRTIKAKNFYFNNISDTERYKHKIKVKIRGYGLNPEGFCKITIINNNELLINLDAPAWAPAIGQPMVFYVDNTVIGGAVTNGF